MAPRQASRGGGVRHSVAAPRRWAAHRVVSPLVRRWEASCANANNVWYCGSSAAMPTPMIRESLQVPMDLPEALRPSLELANTCAAESRDPDPRIHEPRGVAGSVGRCVRARDGTLG